MRIVTRTLDADQGSEQVLARNASGFGPKGEARAPRAPRLYRSGRAPFFLLHGSSVDASQARAGYTLKAAGGAENSGWLAPGRSFCASL